MATHSNILTWRIPWTEKPSGLQSMGSQSVRHDWAHSTMWNFINIIYCVLHSQMNTSTMFIVLQLKPPKMIFNSSQDMLATTSKNIIDPREKQRSGISNIYIYTHTHTHTHIYIYIHMCVCIYIYIHICVCVYIYIYINLAWTWRNINVLFFVLTLISESLF